MNDARLDVKRAWVDTCTVGFGVRIYAAFVPELFVPVGMVWGTGTKDTKGDRSRFIVGYMWTVPWARRQGVQRAIHRQMFEAGCDLLTTPSAADEGVETAIGHLGYIYHRQAGLWVCSKASFRRCDKKSGGERRE